MYCNTYVVTGKTLLCSLTLHPHYARDFERGTFTSFFPSTSTTLKQEVMGSWRETHFENVTITDGRNAWVQTRGLGLITWLSWRHRFSTILKRKHGVFKFLWFEECFQNKTPFSIRINIDGRPNRWNKVAFPNISGVITLSVVQDEWRTW